MPEESILRRSKANTFDEELFLVLESKKLSPTHHIAPKCNLLKKYVVQLETHSSNFKSSLQM